MNTILKTSILAIAGVAAVGSSALAQNPNYAPGDLALFFQDTASSQTIMFNLGSTITYRDATTSTFNITNVGPQLSSLFGASWFDLSTLRVAVAGLRSSDVFGTSVINGDPTRTVYVSRARDTAGANAFTVGTANSAAITLATDTSMNTLSDRVRQVVDRFETATTGTFLQESFTTSNIDNQNPTNGTAAYGTITGGTQDQFNADFGTIGGINAQAALDLYRILARNDLPGTTDGTVRQGEFQGTVVIDNQGAVSFLAVPEPSTFALLGLAGCTLGFVRRRKSA